MADFLDLGEPPASTAPAYRVLARKYRPQSFADLLGQDAMVTTLGNAIARGRLAHAFLLTGVRGVGKTSTARLIAKALNCVGPDGNGGPTINPCGVCEPCVSIAEGRNIDVIEMDAASHTGIDDMRAITDAARLAAFGARFKIYIIDEVHMLSKSAFNGLLKTLEEPPSHVKFLLATTEINKVPVTVLSRCQRFDLRRIPAEVLAAHFARVSMAEGVEAEPEALAMIATAAEGSARDGLSILDQAIAHAGDGGTVTAAQVREMLGLSDRGAVRELLGHLIAGDGSAALAGLRRQYDLGIDPAGVLRGLLELVHATSLVKLGTPPALGEPAEQRAAIEQWAASLSFAALHRLWQLLLKGHEEVARATLPIETAEMALLRVVHAGSLPDPELLARIIAGQAPPPATTGITSAAPAAAPVAVAAPAQVKGVFPADFAALVGAVEKIDGGIAAKLRYSAQVVRYAPPELVLSSARPLAADLLRYLGAVLKQLSGRAWQVSASDQPGALTLRDQELAGRAELEAAVKRQPLVAAALTAFPEATLADGELDRLIAEGWKESA